MKAKNKVGYTVRKLANYSDGSSRYEVETEVYTFHTDKKGVEKFKRDIKSGKRKVNAA